MNESSSSTQGWTMSSNMNWVSDCQFDIQIDIQNADADADATSMTLWRSLR
jgi:hypothetical protein